MAGRTLPGLGLKGDWALGEDAWKDENDLNLLKLSVLTQGRALMKVGAIAGVPAEGDIYILDETNVGNPNQIAVYDEGAWVYIVPEEGWMLYNEAENYFEQFDGIVWAELETGGSLPIGGTTGQALVKLSDADGDAGWDDVASGGGGGEAPAYIHVVDEKASGTNGGVPVNGWQTRTLNTVKANTLTGASLAANDVTLPAGTYYVEASAPAYYVDRHRLRLRNVTAGTTLLLGQAGISPNDVANMSATPALLSGFVTLAVPSVVRLEHYVEQTTANQGFGIASATGEAEIYASMVIEKVVAIAASGGTGGPYMGAHIRRGGAAAQANGASAYVRLIYGTTVHDVGGWFNSAVNNGRLVVPAGVDFVEVACNIGIGSGDNGGDVQMAIRKNGLDIANHVIPDAFFRSITLQTPVLPVVAGDYFEVYIRGAQSQSWDGENHFWIKAVGNLGSASAPLSLALDPLPAFINSWVNYGGAYADLTVTKSGRTVTINGLVKDGTAAKVLTLPAGWRPAKTVSAAVVTQGGTGIAEVESDGELFVYGVGSTTYTHLTFSFLVPEADAWNGGARPSEGVAFPAGPVAGLRFYRTDRKIEYAYDGTRWLSTQLMSLNVPINTAVSADIDNFLPIPFIGVYGIWLERLDGSFFRTAAGEWDIVLRRRNAANAETDLVTLDGAGDAANTFVARGANIGVVLDASAVTMALILKEVSGAAAFYGTAVLHYRLIG